MFRSGNSSMKPCNNRTMKAINQETSDTLVGTSHWQVTEKQGNLNYRPQILSVCNLSLSLRGKQGSVCTFQRIYLVITKMLAHIQRRVINDS